MPHGEPRHALEAIERIDALESELRSLRAAIAPVPSTVPSRRASRLRQAGAALATAILIVGVPLVTLASDTFTDVPDTNTFHAQINAIALAGITTGCGPGIYCPADPVSREQMAGFMHRGFGRVASDTGSSITVPNATLVTVAETTITPGIPGGAVPGANGFLLVNGSVTLYEGNPDNCICSISVRVYVNNVAVPGTQYVFLPDNTVFESGSASIDVAVPVATGVKTVSLRVNEYQGSESLVAYASMTVLYVPFGRSGTDAAAVPPAAIPDPMIGSR
jgi:hypothetical protein